MRYGETVKRPGRPFQLRLRGEIIEGDGQCVFFYLKPRGGVWVCVGALVLAFYDFELAASNFDDDMREAWRRIRAYAKSMRGRGTTPEQLRACSVITGVLA